MSLGCRNKDFVPEDTGTPCEASEWFADGDGDGFGAGDATVSCEQPSGSVEDASDCDDASSAVYPGAPEEDCADPVDYNCDGSVGYADEDGDGFAACEDCDDTNPDLAELGTWYGDADADGYGSADDAVTACEQPDGTVENADDCDDTDADLNPDTVWYADADTDGYGDAASTTAACDQPSGYVADDTDCDDTSADSSPAGTEVCDGEDNDCDGDIDEESTDATTMYADADGDGYGDATTGITDCEHPSGYVADDTDCDDTEAGVNPAADEWCDGIDNNCDGSVDEDTALDVLTWYADADTDGYGDATTSDIDCDQPSGYVADNTDCDDTDGDTNPAADEYCDGHDDDCDGDVNEDSAVDADTWYADTDTDGYGDATSSDVACDQPSGYVADDTDCDDTNADVSPGDVESCNGIDDDCDTDVDEGLIGTGASCPADSCSEILADGTTTDGDYTLQDAAGTTTFDTYCDLNTDSGGWTLVGSVVNEAHVTGSHDRNWDSLAVWTDTTTFGTLSTNEEADFKSMAFSETTGDDVLFVTDEYSFAFYNVAGSVDFADFITNEYDTTACNEDFLASGADWSSGLTTSEASLLSLIVRPQDTNATCFPNGNENALLGVHLSSCCWAAGLGNTPSGYPSWVLYDSSVLDLSSLAPTTCTAGDYPCNDAGYYGGAAGYTYTNKATYTQVYVR